MTPPSYIQSQGQYNQPNQNLRDPDVPTNYVPAYTAEATDYDMGYYDNTGKFHANPHAKSSMPSDVPIPENAHRRQTSMADAAPVGNMPTMSDEYTGGHDTDVDDLYRPRQDATRRSSHISMPGAPRNPPPGGPNSPPASAPVVPGLFPNSERI